MTLSGLTIEMPMGFGLLKRLIERMPLSSVPSSKGL